VTLSRDALELLRRQRWEGNARELENAIERALLLASGDEIRPQDLPFEAVEGRSPAAAAPAAAGGLLDDALARQLTLAELGSLYIERVLALVNGNKVRAARILGINRRTLYRRKDARRARAKTED
jgi:DNA-binding NtrC family response regulator